jgi:subtilase family serine protease
VVLALAAGGIAIAVGHGGGSPGGLGGGSNDATTMSLPGALTSWTQPSWATSKNDLGEADPNTTVTGTVYFAKNNAPDLTTLAIAVGTPGDSQYHKYLTPSQFESRFSNKANAAQAVDQWIQQDGMTVLARTADSETVRTTISKVETALSIKIHRYRRGGQLLLAPTSQPVLPADVGNYVSAITGLTTSSPVSPRTAPAALPAAKPRKKTGRIAPADSMASATANCSRYFGERTVPGVPPSPSGGQLALTTCGYTPAQLRRAYGVSQSGLTGKGVTIAVVDAYASPSIVQDVNRYAREAGLPPLTAGQFSQVVASATSGTTAADAQGWWGEETLDIEAVHTIAPDAKIVYYGAASPQGSDLTAALQDIVAKRAADIVSMSWGGPETEEDRSVISAETQVFEQGAIEGISFNAATGDNGDYTATQQGSTTQAMSSPAVGDPASSPWVTAVGGTTLGTGKNGDYLWETGWGDVAYPQSGGSWDTGQGSFWGAGGGGTSTIFPQPFYQKGVVPGGLSTPSGAQQAMRTVPDVAMDADSATGILVGQSTGSVSSRSSGDGGLTFTLAATGYQYADVGGTSLATPLFSAMEALAQQAAGGTPLGFADPVLYKLAGSSAFHDVQPSPAALGHEPEVVAADQNGNPLLVEMDRDTSLKTAQGYDDTTGIGSPAADFLTWFARHPNGQ